MSQTTQSKKYYIHYDVVSKRFNPDIPTLPVHDDDSGLVLKFDKEEDAKNYCAVKNEGVAKENIAIRIVYKYIEIKEPYFYIQFFIGNTWEFCGEGDEDRMCKNCGDLIIPWGGQMNGNKLYFTDEYLALTYCEEMERKSGDKWPHRYIIVA